MVDRIDKFDPKTFQVKETSEDRNRRQQQEGEEEEKGQEKERDKFEKKDRDLKRLIPESSTQLPSQSTLWGTKPAPHPLVTDAAGDLNRSQEEDSKTPLLENDGEEGSLSLSERLLVLWGIRDLKGSYRAPLIAAYAAVALVIAAAFVLMIGLLWL